jgi:hypothetical protein
MGQTGWSETSAAKYQVTLRDVPEKRRSDLHTAEVWTHAYVVFDGGWLVDFVFVWRRRRSACDSLTFHPRKRNVCLAWDLGKLTLQCASPFLESVTSGFSYTHTHTHARTHSGVFYNERCYKEQFLSIKAGCYNERERILSADVARACAWRVGPSRFD